ncbi:hypothetical protein LCGC14_1294370 [marine sediment metagenome]|uniref:Uncharacterized protein n=1 Tax=marine sediment metagenome TaxID=412755 RepID=A0A0F9KRP6_9ZZZZ
MGFGQSVLGMGIFEAAQLGLGSRGFGALMGRRAMNQYKDVFAEYDTATAERKAQIEKLYTDLTGRVLDSPGGIRALSQSLARDSGGYYGGDSAGMRYNAAMSRSDVAYRQLPGLADRASEGITQGFDTRTQYGQTGANAINTGYQNRYGTSMAMLEGLGNQERQDIGQQYDAYGAGVSQDLTSRGLGGTTVRGSMLAGNERERRDALGRMDERLRRERIGLHTGLTGDTLAARQYGLTQQLGLRGEALGAQQDARNFGMDTRFNAYGARADIARGGLDYRDQSYAQYLANRQAYGMMPHDTDIQTTRDQAQFLADIQTMPPQMPQFPNLYGG